jgi:hypothetical protein
MVFALDEWNIVVLPHPQRYRQVPARWRAKFPGEVTAGLYGWILGFGVLTPISFSSFYVLLAWTALSGTAVLGAAMLGTYGLVRALPPLIVNSFVSGLDAAQQFNLRVQPLSASVSLVLGIVLFSEGLALLAQLVP